MNAVVRKSWGGVRPGSGRKKGTRPGQAIWEAQSLREKYPTMPLEHMLKVLNDVKAPKARRDEMAKAAAPYIHPRLAAVALTDKDPAPVQGSLDLTMLSDKELAFLDQIIRKAHVPLKPPSDDASEVPLLKYDGGGKAD